MQTEYNINDTVLIAAKIINYKTCSNENGDPITEYSLYVKDVDKIVIRSKKAIFGTVSPKCFECD